MLLFSSPGKAWRTAESRSLGQSNKIKPHWVLVSGKPEQHPEGNFYISRRDGKKKIWKKIGPNPSDAVNAAKFEESILNAAALGVQIEPEVPRLDYDAQMWKFLNDYKLSQRLEAHGLMKQTLEEFRTLTKKSVLSEITREDILRYKKWLIERKRSLRTAGNKMLRVNQYLRAAMGEAGRGTRNRERRQVCGARAGGITDDNGRVPQGLLTKV